MQDILATVKHLYIYPVKSMRGLPLAEAHLGLNGIYGDRRYAFVRQALAGVDGFPWMTGRANPRMLLYSPRFERLPAHDDLDPPLHVTTPEGEEYSIADPLLRERLEADYGDRLVPLKNNRGNFDSQHLSLFSLLTWRLLEVESGVAIDKRQFRANVYLEPHDAAPFAEDDWVGHILQIGSAVVAVTKRDTRCMMINLDPGTAVQHPQVLRAVVRNHREQAGVYANVIVPGIVREGDPIRVIAKAGKPEPAHAE